MKIEFPIITDGAKRRPAAGGIPTGYRQKKGPR